MSPFKPLVPAGEGLQRWPEPPLRLRARMAEVYGADPEQVLPVRDVANAVELVLRLLARDSAAVAAAEPSPALERLAAVYRVGFADADAGAMVVASPAWTGEPLSAAAARDLAARTAPGLLVVDETWVELAEAPSLAPLVGEIDNLLVLRSLSGVYGLAGACCGAAIGAQTLLARLAEVQEPWALPTPVVQAAEVALSPSRALAMEARVRAAKAERARLAAALAPADGVAGIGGAGGVLVVRVQNPTAARTALARFGVEADWRGGALRWICADPQAGDRLLAAFGVAVEARPRRRAEVVRDTKETRIAVSVDLDRPGEVRAHTGIGFFDHMLEQVAAHGGFSLSVACEGDLHIDPHHTIEDCMLAAGRALKEALGDRVGVARFGFVLPMDETEAKVSIDLGGRPFAVFDGAFQAERLGDYPTQLTAHAFRSLAESLGAAIHVSVQGQDDHHKTEACFKALGRALRQAVRLEGDALPSTKGVIE